MSSSLIRAQDFSEEKLNNLESEYQSSLNDYQNAHRSFTYLKEIYIKEKNSQNLEKVLDQAKLVMTYRNQVLINFFENLHFYLNNFTNFQSTRKSELNSEIINFQQNFQKNIEQTEIIVDYDTFVDYNEAFKTNLSFAQQLSYNIFYLIKIDKMKFSYQRLNSVVQKIRQNYEQKISNNLEKKELIKKVGKISDSLDNILINLNRLEENYQNINDADRYKHFQSESQLVLDTIYQTKEDLENLIYQ